MIIFFHVFLLNKAHFKNVFNFLNIIIKIYFFEIILLFELKTCFSELKLIKLYFCFTQFFKFLKMFNVKIQIQSTF